MRWIDRYFIKQPLFREWVTRLLYADREQDVTLLEHIVRIHTIKENGYLRASRKAATSSLFRDEVITLQHLMLFVKPKMTFVDIGANIGIFSILMSDVTRIYPDFKVNSFEVHPDTYSRLQINAQRYNFEATNFAIGAEDERRDFVEGAVSHVTTTIEHSNHYNISSRRFQMDVRRLDSFQFDGPLFLKIDVEGQEMAVLEGATKLLDLEQIDAIFIDGFPHDSGIPEFLARRNFLLFDVRTLRPAAQTFALLAIRSAAYPHIRPARSVASLTSFNEMTHA